MRRGALLGALSLALAARAEAASADPPSSDAAGATRESLARWRRGDAGVQVLDPLLAGRIERLRHESPSFALAWETLERSGSPVLIGTGEQLGPVLPAELRRSTAWAGITLSWGEEDGSLLRSVVGVRLEWMRELHRGMGNPEEAFLRAVDEILIHEIYGHLVPVVAVRSTAAHCPDPRSGERLADSCVGRRELALGAELRR